MKAMYQTKKRYKLYQLVQVAEGVWLTTLHAKQLYETLKGASI